MSTSGGGKDDKPPKGPGGLVRRISTFVRRNTSGKEQSMSKSKSKPKPEEDLVENSDGEMETRGARDRRKRHWAQAYLNGPLYGLQPSEVTGLNSSHVPRSRPSPQTVASTPPPVRQRGYSYNTSQDVPEEKVNEQKLIEHLGFDPTSPGRNIRPHQHPVVEPALPPPSPPETSTEDNAVIPSKPGPSTLHRSKSLNPELLRSKLDDPFVDGADNDNDKDNDMSSRPLDQIKRDVKAANRSPHLRKKNIAKPDPIDALDDIAGTYHHDGPFDATLASRNRDKRHSPVEAVKESNMAALRATPPEFIRDSLTKHVPLQGTAVVPPGKRDMFGRRMSYEEGADVMREGDAAGGPYRRYDHVRYHPDDLKGKGEPSYTVERDAKEKKKKKQRASTPEGSQAGAGAGAGASTYEMQPVRPGRQHSASLSGLKRRLGSFRHGH